jgi:hypothetical protein
MAWVAIKESFNSLVHLKVGESLSELTKLGSDVFGGVVAGISGYLIYDILSNKNTKWYQKIIPATFVGIGLALVIPATVAVIVGASTLVPPFMFVASIGAIYRSISTYFQDRTERNNLRKEMIKRSDLDKKISNLNLNAINKEIVNDYLDNTTKIYNKLYQLRKDIINNLDIPIENKKILINELNQAIEKCSKDKNKGNIADIKFSTHLIPETIRQSTNDQIGDIQHLIISYNKACKSINNIVSHSLLKTINAYKITQEKIFSQDLPANVKNKIVVLLEKNKIDKDELKTLYAQVGNHYLNITADQQVIIQDYDFNSYLTEKNVKDKQLETIKNYYQLPREIFSKVNSIKISLNENEPSITEFLQDMVKNPSLISVSQWEKIENSLQNISPVMKQKLYDIHQLVERYSRCSTEFDELNLNIDNNAIKIEITEYRNSSLVQFSNLGLQFPSPKIDFSLKSNDLFHRARKRIFSPKDQIESKYTNESEIAIDAQVNSMTAKKRSRKDAKELKADFKKKFENTFEVIEKKQRLLFLEKVVPRRLANVFLGCGIATISLATTIAIPAIASPAAPIAAVAATVLGGISAALTVISIANSADIIRKDFSSKAKVGSVRHQAKQGIVPSRKWEREKNTKYTKELQENQKRSNEHRKDPLIATRKVHFSDEVETIPEQPHNSKKLKD